MSEKVFDYSVAEMRKKHYEEMIKDLYKSRRDVYFYGAGIYANRLKAYFEKMNIVIKGFVVDDSFLTSDKEGICALSEIIRKDGIALIYAVGGGYSEEFFNKISFLKEIVENMENSVFIVLSDYWMIDLGFVMRHEFIDSNYLNSNIDRFIKTYDLLEDEISRNVMREYIYASISKDAIELGRYGTNNEYDYDLGLLFSNLKDGVIVECGAYDGKSVKQMSEYLGNKYELIAMECDDDNYKICCDNVKDYNNIKVYKLGVWDKKAKLELVQSGDSSYLKEVYDEKESNNSVNVIDIDSLIEAELISALAIDVEGCELNALKGAKNAISRGVNIAVRVYHKKDDLITLPQYIYSLNKEYKFYLRFDRGATQCRTGYETTLYAICDR